jgi:mannosyltransferase
VPAARAFVRKHAALLGILALAALLRFATLGVQSLWSDEAFTWTIASKPFGAAMAQVAGTESTPPLYYALAWVWEHLFGSSEVALRSLPALFGVAAVGVVYAIGAELAGRRVGLAAALLAATSPLLVWYSQEARAYSLLVLLAALSFLFLVRGRVLAWGVVAALAVATHYFAVFLVAGEAAWLLARSRPRRRVLAAAALPAAVAAALVPLALHQGDSVPRPWTGLFSLRQQTSQAAQQLLVGLTWTDFTHRVAVPLLALLALAAVALLLRRGAEAERRAAVPVALVAGSALLAPVAIGLVADNYVAARNVLAALPLLLVLVALGAAGRAGGRLGAAVVAGLAGLFAALTIAVSADGDLQRDDWRDVAAALGPARGTRAIVVVNEFENSRVVHYYRRAAKPGTTAVTEVYVIGRTGELPQAFAGTPPAPGFALTGTKVVRGIGVARFTAPAPVALPPNPYGRTEDTELIEP